MRGVQAEPKTLTARRTCGTARAGTAQASQASAPLEAVAELELKQCDDTSDVTGFRVSEAAVSLVSTSSDEEEDDEDEDNDEDDDDADEDGDEGEGDEEEPLRSMSTNSWSRKWKRARSDEDS